MMKKFNKNLLYILLFSIILSGCGGDSTSSILDNKVDKTISGKAVDGYISGAKVCLDINSNNICDTNEPSTTTSNDGSFTLVSNEKGNYSLLLIGGQDTATGKDFVGILKNVITLNSSNTIIDTRITPLTTISTEIFNKEIKTNPYFTPTQAKQQLAERFDLNISQIEDDPLQDKEVFAKAQQIMQTIQILSKSIQSDKTNSTKNKKAFTHIIQQMAISIKDDNTSTDLNISKIITQLESTTFNDRNISIPSEVKDFTKNYSNNIKEKSQEITNIVNLDNLQNGFEKFAQKIKIEIENNTISSLSDKIIEFKDKNTSLVISEINNSPIFINSNIVSVYENQLNAMDLNATDSDNDTLTYSLNGTDASLFNINKSTGLVMFITKPDYETKISYSFTAQVSDGISSKTKDITISVLNMNDNAPIFTNESNISVDENQLNVIDLNAIDSDNDILTYSISGTDASFFNINTSTGLVTFITEPDYEAKRSYTFTATVSDGKHSNYQIVNIYINNKIDVIPTILNFATSINENISIGTAIGNISIKSQGDSNITSYVLSDTTNFDINKNGIITTRSTFDYERISFYHLSVYATNSAGNSNNQDINISILNINDNSPIFTNENNISVDENQLYAIDLNATDSDNDILTFRISGTDASSFKLNPSTGKVYFIREPNYETKILYTFIATVSDGNNELNQSINININNLNDNDPVFTNSNTVSIDEKQFDAITLDATDSDNDTLSYSISGTDASFFNINISTGIVTFIAVPEYATKKLYTFTATVNDGIHSVNQSINININKVLTNTGIFIDSLVEGLDYNTSSNIKGRTNAKGEYIYNDNDTITFSIKNIILGTTSAQEVITPLSLYTTKDITNKKVLNLLVLLQTLDDDNNPENGIKLSSYKINKLKDLILNFSDDFDIYDILNKYDFIQSDIKSKLDALNHFKTTISSNNIEVDTVRSETYAVKNDNNDGNYDYLYTTKYNELGQILTKNKSIIGTNESYVYRKYIYDNINRLLKEISISSSGEETIVNSYVYNDLGLLIEKKHYNDKITYFYDENKTLIKEVYTYNNSSYKVILYFKENDILYKKEIFRDNNIIERHIYSDINIKFSSIYIWAGNYSNNLKHGLLTSITYGSDQNTEKSYTYNKNHKIKIIKHIDKTTNQITSKYINTWDSYNNIIKQEYVNSSNSDYNYIYTWDRTYFNDIKIETIKKRNDNIIEIWEYFDNGEAKTYEFFGFRYNRSARINSNVAHDNKYSNEYFKYLYREYILKNNKSFLKKVKISKIDNNTDLINIDYYWNNKDKTNKIVYIQSDNITSETNILYYENGDINKVIYYDGRVNNYLKKVQNKPETIINKESNTNVVTMTITHDNILHKNTQLTKYYYDNKDRLVNTTIFDLNNKFNITNVIYLKWNDNNQVIEKKTNDLTIHTEYINDQISKEIHSHKEYDNNTGKYIDYNDTYAYSYSYSSNIKTITIKIDLKTNGSIDKILTKKYDSNNILIDEESNENNSATYRYEYNINNNLHKKIWVYPNMDDLIIENYIYESTNKIKKVLYVDWSDYEIISYNPYKIKYDYDSVRYEYQNNLISRTMNDNDDDGSIESEVHYYYLK